MSNYIKEFCKKALGDETSFSIVDDGVLVIFTVYPVGKANYIFASRQYRNMGNVIDIGTKLELAAITADSRVYVMNHWLCGQKYTDSQSLPEAAEDFSAYFTRKKKELSKMFYKDFYPSLDISDTKIAENCVQKIKDAARNILLSLEPQKQKEEKKDYVDFIKEQDVVNDLCGIKDLRSYALEQWNEKINLIKANKILDREIKRYVEDKSCVTPLELELIKALRTVKQAKTVTLELESGEHSFSIKADLEKLVYQIWRGDTCSIADTVSVQSLAENTTLALGYKKYDKIPASCIKAIYYGKKKIF